MTAAMRIAWWSEGGEMFQNFLNLTSDNGFSVIITGSFCLFGFVNFFAVLSRFEIHPFSKRSLISRSKRKIGSNLFIPFLIVFFGWELAMGSAFVTDLIRPDSHHDSNPLWFFGWSISAFTMGLLSLFSPNLSSQVISNQPEELSKSPFERISESEKSNERFQSMLQRPIGAIFVIVAAIMFYDQFAHNHYPISVIQHDIEDLQTALNTGQKVPVRDQDK